MCKEALDTVIENNQAYVKGTIISKFTYSHELFGERFYMVDLQVKRQSSTVDVIPLMISERLINVTQDYTGVYLMATGQFRSYNKHGSDKTHVKLSFWTRDVDFLEEEPDGNDSNYICLEGYLCKKPIYRKTPLGREIADLLLAVNRPYGKSDYIPCVCWGRNARYVAGFNIGDRFELIGRIQSRQYTKKFGEDKEETRTAYEVSVSKLTIC